jgi:hypothetical protein
LPELAPFPAAPVDGNHRTHFQHLQQRRPVPMPLIGSPPRPTVRMQRKSRDMCATRRIDFPCRVCFSQEAGGQLVDFAAQPREVSCAWRNA